MEKKIAAASHGNPNSAGDLSSGLETSASSSSVPKPTSSSASSAPMKNPPPPELVSPAPEHPKAADCSQKSNVSASDEIKSVWKKPLTKVSAPVDVDDSTWPALGQIPKKSPSIPKHPARGVSVVKKASKVSEASSSSENRTVKSDFPAGKNTPKVLEPSSAETNLIAGSSSDSPVAIHHPTELGSSSRGPNPSSVPPVQEAAPKNTSTQTPNVPEPSSSTTNLMVGSSSDSAAVSSKSKRRWSRRRGNRSHRNNRGPQQNNSTASSSRGPSSARGPNPPLPMIPQGIGRGFIRSSPLGNPNLPFMVPPPPPLRPFGSPLFYPYGAPFMHFTPVPAGLGYHPSMSFHHMPRPVRPPPFIYHPALLPGDALPRKIVEQIDFYFSEENLFKDGYLKSKMDEEGWVPVSLVAGFPRVRRLTTSIPLILDSMRGSYVVEVKDDKLRKRHGWRKWVTPDLPFQVPVAGG